MTVPQRVRERLREGRHRLLGRLRGLDATSAASLPGRSGALSDQDQLLAEWEQLERDIIAEGRALLQSCWGSRESFVVKMTSRCIRMISA